MMGLKKSFPIIAFFLVLSILSVVVAQEPPSPPEQRQTDTPTATSTPTATNTPTETLTSTATSTLTVTSMPTEILIPTNQPSATATETSTASAVPSITPQDSSSFLIQPLNQSASAQSVGTCGNYEVAVGDVTSLIEAINQGNGAGTAYTICLQEGQYILTAIDNSNNGLPVITGDITILGMGLTGADILRDTSGTPPQYRFFYIDTGASLTLDNVDLSDGDVSNSISIEGGAVFNLGTFTAQNGSDFSNNKAGDDGGAIRNELGASIIIDGSNFSNNYAGDDGAAIDNWGSATISNTTFYNNIVDGNEGGAIDNHGTPMMISDSIFNANKVLGAYGNGGAIANGAGLSLTITGNSQFLNNETTDDGGAIVNEGLLTIDGATFDNNKAGIQGGAIYNKGIENNTISNSTFTNNQVLVGGDNGGAIANSAPLTITSSTFDSNSTGDDGGAIANEDLLDIDGTTFDNNTAGVEGGAIYNLGTQNNTISNSSFTNNQILAGGDDGGAIDNHAPLTITNSTFNLNVNHGDDGGAIWNDSNARLEIYDSSFTNNAVDGGLSSTGGAIHNFGNLIVERTLFENNTSSDNGGAIYGSGSLSDINISGAELRLNSAADRGGAIYISGSTLVVGGNSLFTNNSATNHAGAIFFNTSSPSIISDSILENNSSLTGSGGAIYNTGTDLTVSNTELRGNSASVDGGAVYNSGTFWLNQGSVIDNNQANDDGGGIYSNSADILKIDASILKNNIAVDEGGAVRTSSDVINSYIRTSCIYGNTAPTTTGVRSNASDFDAINNWWGASDGPGGAGSGSGDEINSNVLFDPFTPTQVDCPVGQFDIVSAEAIYVEDDPPVNLFTSFEITDPDISQVSSVTITINNLIDGADELLDVDLNLIGITGITKSYDPATGILTLLPDTITPNNTPADYSKVIETLTYINTSQDPDEATRDIEIVVTDITPDPDHSTHPGRIRVAVVSVPDAPNLALDTDINSTTAPNFSTSYTEGQLPTLIVNEVPNGPSLSDVDDENLASVRVDLTNPLDNFSEILSVDSTALSNASISSVWAGNSLYLSGSASLSEYVSVLQTLNYVNHSDTPNLAENRTVNVTAFDGEVESNLVFADVTLANANTPPTVNLDADNSERHSPNYETVFQIDGNPVNLTHDDVSVIDPDTSQLVSATIEITNPDPDDVITVDEAWMLANTTITVTSAYDPVTGLMVLGGSASPNEYASVLATLQFQNTSSEPDTTDRIINIKVNDGTVDSEVVTSTVTLVGQFPSEVTCLDLRTQNDWADTSGAGGHVVWDAVLGMYGVDDSGSGATVSASYDIGVSGNYRVVVATSGDGEYDLLYGSTVPTTGETAPFTAISRSSEVYDIRDRVIQLEWTVDAQNNPVFEHLCYVPLDSDLPDLTVTNVDVSGMVIDPITLEINGTVSATIDNIGPADAPEPFTVLFYEDPDADGYQVGDPILTSTTVDSLSINDPQTVSAPVSGIAPFAGIPVYTFVDSDDVVIESDETNNIADSWVCNPVVTTISFDITNENIHYYEANASSVYDLYFYGVAITDGWIDALYWKGYSIESMREAYGKDLGIKVNDIYIETQPFNPTHEYLYSNIQGTNATWTFQYRDWYLPNNSGFLYVDIIQKSQSCDPDLTASYPRSSGQTDLTVRIGNGGSVYVPAGVSISFYDGDPNYASSTLLGTTVTTKLLEPGDWEDVTITVSGSLTAPAIWMVADDLGDTTGINGEYDELNEDNNIVHLWNPSYYLADLTVNDVDVSAMSIDPNSLEISGTVTATIENIGVKSAGETFTVLFYEDPDADGYQVGDPVLGSSDLINGLTLNIPTQVSAPVSGTASFVDVPVYAFVDDGGDVAESNESNNTGWNLGECQLGITQDWSAGLNLEWQWHQNNQHVISPPLVADVNLDTTPEIVVISYPGTAAQDNGVLRILKGDTGDLLHSSSDYVDYPQLASSTAPALGNIDTNDPYPEIIAIHENQNTLVAFDHEAKVIWNKTYSNLSFGNNSAVTLADLNQDGTTEILVGAHVFSANGDWLWSGAYGHGGGISIVANIDLQGLPEIIAGNTVYEYNTSTQLWTKRWQNATYGDNVTAIANLDTNTPQPEIVLKYTNRLVVFDYLGNVVWDISENIDGYGAPTIGNIDSDSEPEIGAAGSNRYGVYDYVNGVIQIYKMGIDDNTITGRTGSIMFDFDGDGNAVIVYVDEPSLRIFGGSPVTQLYSISNSNRTQREYPTVADVDGDGNAEILVPVSSTSSSVGGLKIYGSLTNSWLPTRRIWNQYSYHITNVNDDGSIPTYEANNWDIYNNYRQNVYTAGCVTGQPDLTASYARRTQLPATSQVQLTARIGNGGSVYVPAGVSVTFYDGDPQNGGNILGTTTTTQLLEPGQWEDVSITVMDTTTATPLWVVADDTGGLVGQHDELNELNNILASNVYVMYPPNDEPTASASAATTWDMGTQGDIMSLTGSVADNVWPINTLTATWEVVAAPHAVDIAQEEHVFSAQTPPYPAVDTTVTFDAGGTYTFRIRVTDGEFTRYSVPATVEVTGPPVPPTPPIPDPELHENTCIISPNHADTVTGLVDIDVLAGTNLVNASVFYWPAHDPQLWKTLSYDGTLYEGIPITDTTEIIFDTTVLANDTYGVQIVGSDATSGDRIVCGVGLIVTGEYKPGRVVLSTVDFTVPLAGLPITVGRTYDSLERDYIGDFGYGWELAIGKPRLEIDDSNNVTLTMPDGTRKTFYWAPTPYPLLGFLSEPNNFQNEPGENGSFDTDGCLLLVSGSSICFLGFGSGSSYFIDTVTQFTYEDPYGREFVYSKGGDLLSITDLNGNQITFDANGIYSSAGLGVTFTRDTQGRIETASAQISPTEIVVYTYVYDPVTGDLIEVQLPQADNPSLPDTVNPIGYEYYPDEVYTDPSLAHFFKSGTDANGIAVATTTYYPDGRIETVTDALNNVTTYTYDVAGHTTTVEIRDIGDNLLSHEETSYDDYGNVLSEKIYVKADGSQTRLTRYAYNANNDPLYICDNAIAEAVPCDENNFTTKYSYDSDGNRTAVTNAEGVEVISASYNDYGGPTSLTDANGVARNITYNAQAMPSTATDVLGTIGSYTWTPQGSPATVTDAVGSTTQYAYDAYGNVEYMCDATVDTSTTSCGSENYSMRYVYDDMGRRTHTCDIYVLPTETCSDANAVSYTTYDALGRVLTTTQQDRNASSVYDVISRTTYTYDANGNRKTVTAHEDGYVDLTTDRTTEYFYDFNNRVTQVAYPDGTSSYTDYDHRGNVIEQTDVRGVSTCYEYDLAGQLIQTTFACGDDGEPGGDANNVYARYGYDAVGRRILSVEGDGSGYDLFSHYTYDAVGRIERMQITDSEVIDPVTTTIYSDTCYDYDDAGQLLQMRVAMETRTSCHPELEQPPQPSIQEAITQYHYDARGRRDKVTYPDGSKTSSVYDGVGRVTTSLDAAGTATNYTYDVLGSLTEIVQGANVNPSIRTRYAYDDLGRRIGVCDNTVTGNCDENSFTTSYEYLGLTTKVNTHTPTTSYTSTSTYNLFGEVVYQQDPNGYLLGYGTTYSYEYDAANFTRKVTVAHAAGLSMQNSAETVYFKGQRQSVTVGIQGTDTGYTTYYIHDVETGRLLGVCDPSVTVLCNEANITSATTRYGYDARGRQNAITDANGYTTNYSYDPAGRLTTITDAANGTTSYDYDTLGRRESITDAEGNVTFYTYNVMGRVNDVTQAYGTQNALVTASYEYDILGRQIAMIDGNGNRNEYSYNNLGWLKTVKNGEGNTVRYNYDNMGRVSEIYNGNDIPNPFIDAPTSFDYDARGLLTQKQWPDGNYETYSYDGNGNMTAQGFYDNNDIPQATHAFYYDPLNRLEQADYGDVHYAFVYNSRGQRSEVWDWDASKLLTEYDYDVLGRPTEIYHDNGAVGPDATDEYVLYDYDPVGNRTSIETQIGGIQQSQVSYGYDELNRLDTVTEGTDITTIGYNAIGQMTTLNRPNGINTIYSYADENPYVVSDIEHKQGMTLISGFHYEYDDAGNREQMSDLVTNVDINYYYDQANRLIEEMRDNSGVISSTQYVYDANGNRVQEIRPNDDIYYYTYNKNDQLTQIDMPDYVKQVYSYDNRGNLDKVEDFIGINLQGTTNYTYDARNQLIDFDGLATFEYDHDGRRISATANAVTTNYLWDEFSSYGDVVLETGTNGTRSYTLANGMLISQTDTAGTLYFLPDAQGSTRALAKADGSLGQTYDYDAFGNLQGDYQSGLDTNYLYTGQQYDVISELYSLRARYYDASIGRFLSRDTWPYDYQNPVELNRYVYTANNPATMVDPSGYVAAVKYSAGHTPAASLIVLSKSHASYGLFVGLNVLPWVGALLEGFRWLIEELFRRFPHTRQDPVPPTNREDLPGRDTGGNPDDNPDDNRNPNRDTDPNRDSPPDDDCEDGDDDCDDERTRDFMHGSTIPIIDDIIANGLDEAKARANSRGGSVNRPGYFFTIEVTPQNYISAAREALNFAHRHTISRDVGVLIMQMNSNLFDQIQAAGWVETRPIAGLPGFTETLFHPDSYPTINAAAKIGHVTYVRLVP